MTDQTPTAVPLEGVEEYVSSLQEADDRAPSMMRVLADIARAQARTDAEQGERNYRDGTGGHMIEAVAVMSANTLQRAVDRGNVTWNVIMAQKVHAATAETDPRVLRAHLIEVAATAAAWAQCLDRRLGIAAYCESADKYRMEHPPVVPIAAPAAVRQLEA